MAIIRLQNLTIKFTVLLHLIKPTAKAWGNEEYISPNNLEILVLKKKDLKIDHLASISGRKTGFSKSYPFQSSKWHKCKLLAPFNLNKDQNHCRL